MEALLATTTQGHVVPRSALPNMPRSRVWWSFRARDIALRAMERQPLAPPASTVLESDARNTYQDGGSSCSAMPASDSPLIDKRGLEDETEITDVPVEHQGDAKWRKEQQIMSETADSTRCVLGSLCKSRGNRLPSRWIGNARLDGKTACHQCRKLKKFETALVSCFSNRFCWRRLRASTGGSARDFKCQLYEMQVRPGRYFLHTQSHSADRWDQPQIVDFMNSFQIHSRQGLTVACLAQTTLEKGIRDGHGMKTLTGPLPNSGCIAQALSTSTLRSRTRRSHSTHRRSHAADRAQTRRTAVAPR